MAVLKILRNETLYQSRQAASAAIDTKAATLGDGEMWIATYEILDDQQQRIGAKSILAIKRTWGVTKFDLDAIDADIASQIQTALSNLTASDIPITDTGGLFDPSTDNVEDALAELKGDIATVGGAAKSYKIVAVQNPSNTNLAEYKIQEQVGSGSWGDVSGSTTIAVPKDQHLKSVELVNQRPADTEHGETDPVSGQFLKFTYILNNGTEKDVYVDVSTFLVESEFGNGLEVSNAGVVSVEVDSTSETDSQSTPVAFLTVGADGIKLQGVKAEMDRKIAALDATVGSTTVATGKHVAVQIVEADGVLTGVTVTEDDIASADELTEAKRVTSAALNDLETRKAEKTELATISGSVLEQVVAGNGINVTSKANKSQTVSLKLDNANDNALTLSANGLYLSSTIDCGEY